MIRLDRLGMHVINRPRAYSRVFCSFLARQSASKILVADKSSSLFISDFVSRTPPRTLISAVSIGASSNYTNRAPRHLTSCPFVGDSTVTSFKQSHALEASHEDISETTTSSAAAHNSDDDLLVSRQEVK